MNKIKLIAGLSNPGKIYTNTRHNIGAQYIKSLAKKYKTKLKNNKKLIGYTNKLKIENSIVHLFIPNTYINNSGNAILNFIKYFKINITEIMIVHDDLDIPIGRAKIKLGGKNCTHNGIKDIQKKLKNHNFYRLKIGIGHPGRKKEVINYLLNIPNNIEQKSINESINKSINCTQILFKKGIQEAINELHFYKK